MKRVCKKIILLFLLFSSFLVYAQKDNRDKIFTKIDQAFLEKSSESIYNLLNENRSSPNYSEYENYVLKCTRGLIMTNQLELIQQMSLAIINNNLDNFDAASLYSSVEKLIEKRNVQLAEEQKEKQKELALVNAVSQEKREKIRDEYTTVQTTAGESVFINPVRSESSNISWQVAFSMIDVGLVFKVTPNVSFGAKYGIGLLGGFTYVGETISFSTNLFADAHLLNFDGEKGLFAYAELIPSIAINALSKNIFLRLGFMVDKFTSDDKQVFYTPVGGIGYINNNLGALKLSGYLDYYPGHFATDNLLAAFGLGMNCTNKLAEFDSIGMSLSLIIGLRENLYLTTSNDAGIGANSRTRVIIGFGVGSND